MARLGSNTTIGAFVYKEFGDFIVMIDCDVQRSVTLFVFGIDVGAPGDQQSCYILAAKPYSMMKGSILASFWIFARVRVLSRFFASYRGI